jgi:putative pyruvate formate lyase activating enzyme
MEGRETGPKRLAEMMLELQAMGCHNINFVTPSHVVPQILEALPIAVEAGLQLPIVYNTSAYDELDTLKLLDGVVDIYMPDFKIWDEANASTYLTAEDYPVIARAAIREMHRQVGDLKMDERGIAKCGVLIRHLVMPDAVANTRAIMQFLVEEVSPDTFVNMMAQYRPSGEVSSTQFQVLNRRPTRGEFNTAVEDAKEVGIWRFDERRSWIFLG